MFIAGRKSAFAEENARIKDLKNRVLELEAALRPFAFDDLEDEGEPNSLQFIWEIIYQDRFQDWIDCQDIENARIALGVNN